jgi:hypothetical protein
LLQYRATRFDRTLPTAPSGIAAEAVDDDGDAIALRSLLGPHVTPAPSLLRQANHLRNAAGIHECHPCQGYMEAGWQGSSTERLCYLEQKEEALLLQLTCGLLVFFAITCGK